MFCFPPPTRNGFENKACLSCSLLFFFSIAQASKPNPLPSQRWEIPSIWHTQVAQLEAAGGEGLSQVKLENRNLLREKRNCNNKSMHSLRILSLQVSTFCSSIKIPLSFLPFIIEKRKFPIKLCWNGKLPTHAHMSLIRQHKTAKYFRLDFVGCS